MVCQSIGDVLCCFVEELHCGEITSNARIIFYTAHVCAFVNGSTRNGARRKIPSLVRVGEWKAALTGPWIFRQ